EDVRFGALALDDVGLLHWGDCHMFLKTELSEYRTSVFTENTAAFAAKNNMVIPHGHRSTWADRGRLAVAKLARDLKPSTTTADFPRILKADGASSETATFLEAHIYGSISIRTVSQVSLSNVSKRRGKLGAFRDNLKKYSVSFKAM